MKINIKRLTIILVLNTFILGNTFPAFFYAVAEKNHNCNISNSDLLYDESKYLHVYPTPDEANKKGGYWLISEAVTDLLRNRWKEGKRGVYIHRGVYTDWVTIDRGIEDIVDIVGEDRENVIINLNFTSSAFHLGENAYNVYLHNLTVLNSGNRTTDAGFVIHAHKVKNSIKIYNCTVKNCSRGFYFETGKGIIIENCTIMGCDYGMEFHLLSSDNQILNCECRYPKDHSLVVKSHDNIFSDCCIISDDIVGSSIDISGNNNIFQHCNITTNPQNSSVRGIYIHGDNNKIIFCNISYFSLQGIFIEGGDSNEIINCKITHCKDTGIELKGLSSSLPIKNNRIIDDCFIARNRKVGISLTWTDNTLIESNRIKYNGKTRHKYWNKAEQECGLLIYDTSCTGNVIKNNIFLNPDVPDIVCYSFKNSFEGNWYDDWNELKNKTICKRRGYPIEPRIDCISIFCNYDPHPNSSNKSAPPPVVQIIYPAGGECFKDNFINITWNAYVPGYGHQDITIETSIFYREWNIGGNYGEWILINRTNVKGGISTYQWNITGIKEGFYQINVTASYVGEGIDPCRSCIIQPFSIYSKGPKISKVVITDIDINSTEYIRDDDVVTIEVTICGNELDENSIYADLSELGGGEEEKPEKYTESGLYVWRIENANVNEANNFAYVIVKANDITGEARNVGYSQVERKDTQKPEKCEILKPSHGIYINNKKILPKLLGWSVVIGDITVEVTAEDKESGIEKIEFYSRGYLLGYIDVKEEREVYEWEWTESEIGLFYARAYDKAGNYKDSKMIFIIKIG